VWFCLDPNQDLAPGVVERAAHNLPRGLGLAERWRVAISHHRDVSRSACQLPI